MKITSRLNIKNDSINQSQDSREAISKQDEIEKELIIWTGTTKNDAYGKYIIKQ